MHDATGGGPRASATTWLTLDATLFYFVCALIPCSSSTEPAGDGASRLTDFHRVLPRSPASSSFAGARTCSFSVSQADAPATPGAPDAPTEGLRQPSPLTDFHQVLRPRSPTPHNTLLSSLLCHVPTLADVAPVAARLASLKRSPRSVAGLAPACARDLSACSPGLAADYWGGDAAGDDNSLVGTEAARLDEENTELRAVLALAEREQAAAAAELAETRRRAEGSLAAAAQEAAARDAELDALAGEVVEMAAENEALRGDMGRLRKEPEGTRAAAAAAGSRAGLRRLEGKVREGRAAGEVREAELQADIQRLEEELEESRLSNKVVTTKLEELQDEVKAKESPGQELGSAKPHPLQVHVDKLMTDASTLQTELSAAQAARDSLTMEVSQLKDWQSTAEKELEDVRAVNESKTSAVEALQERLAAAQDLHRPQKETDGDLSRDGECPQNQTDGLEAKETRTDAIVAHLRSQVEERDDKLRELEELLRDSNRLPGEANDVARGIFRDDEGPQRQASDLGATNESNDDATAALLRRPVDERDAKVAEREELLQNDTDDSSAMIEALQEQLKSSAETRKRLEDVLRTKEDENEKISSQMKELQDQAEAVRDSLAQKSDEASTLKMELQQKKDKEREIQRLKEDVNQLKIELQEREIAMAEMKSDLTEKETEMQEREEILSSQIKGIRDHLEATKTEETSHLNGKIFQLKAELQKKGKAFQERLIKEQRFRDDENCRLNTAIGHKEKEIKHLHDEIDRLNIKLQKKETMMKEMKSDIIENEIELQEGKEVSSKKMTEERESRQDENRRLSTVLCAKEKEICELNEWKQQSSGLIEQQSNKLKAMTSKISDLTCRCKETEETITSKETELQTKAREIKHLNDDAHQLKHELQKRDTMIGQMKHDKTEKETELLKRDDVISSQMKEMQNQVEITEDSMAKKSEEASTLTASIHQLQVELQKKEKAFQDKLTEEQGSRDNENFRLNTTLREKEKEIEDLNDNVDQLKTKLQKRETIIKEIKTELQKKEEVFHKKLSEERESRQDESRRLCAKEREVRQLSNDVTLAVAESRKLQCTIDSMRLMAEPTRVEISDLREWKQQKLGLIEQQRNELKTMKGDMLNLNCQRKDMQETIASREKELQERKEAFERKLIEERGSRQDENRRLRTALCVKEREINQLNDDIRMAVADAKKHLRTIDSMRLIAESTSMEISSLKSWKQQTSVVMEELINELEGMKSEISGLTCSCEERQEKINTLEKQMQEKEEILNKKLIEERGSRQDENRRLRTALSEKENEIKQHKADAKEAITNTKKLQATIYSMSLLNEPILAENLDLKEAIEDSASEKKK